MHLSNVDDRKRDDISRRRRVDNVISVVALTDVRRRQIGDALRHRGYCILYKIQYAY